MHSHAARPDTFELFVASLPGVPSAAIPIAGAKAGGIGLVNLCHVSNHSETEECIEALVQTVPERCGLILPLTECDSTILNHGRRWQVILLAHNGRQTNLGAAIAACQKKAERVGVVVTDIEQAQSAFEAGADLLVAKGHEAGGFVGEETTFVLVQRLAALFDLPIVAWGGIGWNTAAACRAGGCAGVILDWQFALTRESSLPLPLRRRLSNVDGSETFAMPITPASYVRFFSQPGFTAKDRLETVVAAAESDGESPSEYCHRAISDSLASSSPSDVILLTGQDIGFAPSWAARSSSTGRLIRTLHDALDEQVARAAKSQALSQDSPLAKSHGTEFPLVQGPMTRVSDVPEFCEAVGLAGGLPFLALALMGGDQVRRLLSETKERMGEKSWGVGILGFVPQEIRAQQWPVIEEYCPPYAIIAGGRPDQAASLEARGIATYLHVPSPGMLEMFIQDGARRFIFEGRECGGHVGPRTSFVLWETMVRVLAETSLSAEECAKVHVLFAGGIHDGLGAAMVAALVQPLVERGMKIGALMGTAYLFTHEAVATGAIVPAFQSICLTTNSSVVVESGPGHAIRCADTEFVRVFEEEKRRLIKEKWPAEDVRNRLEHLNLGRLRIAAKGVARSSPQQADLLELNEAEQRSQGMYMLGQVASLREEVCAIRHLHESVCDGATAVLEKFESPTPKTWPVARAPRPLDLAIVGMSCLVPGADSPAKLWHNILAKHDPIRLIPEDRFDHTQWFDADRTARDRIYSKWGGFIPDITFDPIKYGIPPASLKSIEPMQLLALELVARVLRDAGYDEVNPYRERTSVILGVGGGSGELGASYSFRSMAPRYLQNPDETIWSQLPEWTEDSFAGILLNVVAGRISNRFDLGGMNCTVDAACASSLAAVYAGAQELSTGNSDMVIVGGCDTIQNSMGYLCFATAGALSPTGRARVFDASADGIVISEGHGAIVLKRREDAERDGDKVYAILRGIAAGSDGRSKGLSAPRLEGQLRTLRRTYEGAGIDPTSIGLFEAHGTGTAVGDQTECLALTTFLKESGAKPLSAAIGSVKSGIGHTKCAAGVIGVIKSALALHHRILPPTMHVEQPNAKAGFGDGALYVNSETRPWLQAGGPRRAGVSSFGFGGTNFHAILEECSSSKAVSRTTLRENYASELFAFSADSLPTLLAAVSSFVRELTTAVAAQDQIPLHRVAYAQHLKHGGLNGRLRVAIVATDAADLLAKLQRFAAAHSDATTTAKPLPSGIHFALEPVGPSAPVAVVFPGQGSQFPNMLRDLAVEFGEISSCFERASRTLSPIIEESIFDLVFPSPAFTESEKQSQVERLKATRFAQPALGICDIAMWRLLNAFSVRADFVAGHSYGELAALCAAGCMTESDLVKLSAARGSAMTTGVSDDSPQAAAGSSGQMLAVSSDALTVKSVLAGVEEVWLANLNGPRQTVISGTNAGITAASQRLAEAKIPARLLPVSAAFHSPLMQAARERFDQALSQVNFGAARIPVYSNVTAEPYSADGSSVRSLLGDQLQHEVRFAEEIERMYHDGARVFIEAGPKGVLTSLVRDILGDRPHVAIATQPTSSNGVTTFLDCLAELVAQGASVNLDRLYEDRTIEPLQLGKAAAAKKDSPHAWLVNGAYCRPISEPPRVPAPKATLSTANANGELKRHVSVSSNGHRNEPRFAETSPPQSGVRFAVADTDGNGARAQVGARNAEHTNDGDGGASIHTNGDGHSGHFESHAANSSMDQDSMDLEAYALFQESMRQFLETQERVMRFQFGAFHDSAQNGDGSLLNGAGPRIASAAVSHSPSQVESTPTKRSAPLEPSTSNGVAEVPNEPAPKRPEPSIAQSNAQLSVSRDETLQRCLSTLLKIVEDRTGYPIDMLDPDANLEADLGIDSIKRVEIIAAFRRAELEAFPEQPANMMERMTAARTMRAIVESAADLIPWSAENEPIEQAPLATGEQPVQPTLSLDVCIDGLVKLVADRTGYPTDMLDADARLEADLGIDSIKRVEIIAAFRREVLSDSQNFPANLMERLTAAPTIRAIAECAAELAAGSNKVVSEPPVMSKGEHGNEQPDVRIALCADDLLVNLMQVVADRTGYPIEMLDADAKLEADLGIDSIKRVEIIAAFQRDALKDAQQPPNGFVEQLTSAKTMRELVAIVTATLSADAATPVISLAKEIAPPSKVSISSRADTAALDSKQLQPAQTCPRCEAVTVDAPFPSDSVELADGVVIITEGSSGLAAQVADELSTIGRSTFRIAESKLKSNTDAFEAVEAARRQHGRIAGIIHLAGLSNVPTFPGLTSTEWTERQGIELKGLLYLLQSIIPELDADTPVLVSAFTTGGGDFDSSASEVESACPWRGGIAGLLKVAALEYPSHVFHAVDLDDKPTPSLVLRESLGKGAVEIGYRRGKRLMVVSHPKNVAETDQSAELPISSNSVVLVTGGGRGITAQVVQEVAAHVPATFVLVGRSELPSYEESPDTAKFDGDAEIRLAIIGRKKSRGEEVTISAVERELSQLKSSRDIRKTVAELEAAGVRAEYISCDIRNPAAVQSLVEDVRWRYGKIDAFIHGAGVLRDQMIKDKTPEAFDDVVSTKVESLLYFLQAIGPEHLSLVVLFSSVSGFFGNTGQCDYAAANEILNRCARRLQSSSSAKVVSLNWGPWSDVGMVTAEVAKKMRSNGVQLIAPAAGRTAAWQEIIADRSHSVRSILGFGPWIESGDNSILAQAATLGSAPPPLLAGQDIRQGSDGSITAKILLSPDRQPFLVDHCIDGKPVLPLAMAVELMAETASVAQPGWHVIEVADIRMLSGIVLEKHAKEVTVRAELTQRDKARSEWRVQILDADGKRRLYQSVVTLSSSPPTRPAAPAIPNIEQASLLTAVEAYERCLFHGPAFQVITEIMRVDETGIDAIATPSDATQCMARSVGPWHIDAVILDATAQLALLWSEITHDVVMLPTRAARYQAFGDLGSDPVEIQLRTRRAAERNTYKADIWIIREGIVLGHIEGLEGAGSSQLNRIMAGNSR